MRYLLEKEEYDNLVHVKELAEEKVDAEVKARCQAWHTKAKEVISAELSRYSPEQGSVWREDMMSHAIFKRLRDFFETIKPNELPQVQRPTR